MKLVAVLFAAAIAGVGCARASFNVSGSATDERSIRALLAEYDSSWATHDSDRRIKLFANDADITNVVGETKHGLAGLIELRGTPRYQQMYANAVEKFDSVSIRFITAAVAHVNAHWTMTGAKHPDGTSWPLRRGYLSLVLRKDAGVWLITVFDNAEIPARP